MAADDTVNIIIKGDARHFKDEVKQSNTAVRSFGADAKKALAMLGVATGAAAAVRAVKQFVGESLQEFTKFEAGTAEVFTLMPGMTAQAMGDMRRDVVEFAKETGRLTDEVVPALYQAISAGVPPENVFDFLDTAHQAALGGVTDLTTAIDGITSVVNAYGADVLSATQASDAMFTAVRLGKTTFGELSASLSNATPLAAALGVKFSDMVAALAQMTAQGTVTAQATVQIRGLLQELGQQGTVVDQAFRQVAGVGFADFIAQGHNLADALQVVEEASRATGIPVQDLFGNVRGGLGALQLTGQAMDGFVDKLQEMDDSLGATGLAAQVMSEVTQRKLEEAEAAAEAMKIAFGEGVSEFNTSTADAKKALFGWAEGLLSVSNAASYAERELKALGVSNLEAAKAARVVEVGSREQGGAVRDGAEAMKRANIILQLYAAGWQGTRDELRDVVYSILQANKTVEENVALMTGATSADWRFAASQEAVAEATTDTGDALAETTDVLDEYRQAIADAEHSKLLQELGMTDLAYARLVVSLGSVTEAEEYLQSVQRDLATSTQEYSVTLADQQAAEERRKALADEVAAAEQALADARAEAAARTGDAFMQATQGAGFFTQEIANMNERSGQALVSQDAVNLALVKAADAAGGSAVELALLGSAMGVYSDEAARAALQSALIQQKVEGLAAAYLDGSKSIGQIQSELDAFIQHVQNVELPTASAAEAAAAYTEAVEGMPASKMLQLESNLPDQQSALDTYTGDIGNLVDDAPYAVDIETNAQDVLDDLGEVHSELNDLPDIRRTITYTYITQGTPPPATSPSGGGRQTGGRILPGWLYEVGEAGPELFMADVPGTIVPNGRVNTLINALPTAASSAGSAAARQGDTYIFQVDARGATDPEQVKRMAEEGVRSALERLGKQLALERRRS